MTIPGRALNSGCSATFATNSTNTTLMTARPRPLDLMMVECVIMGTGPSRERTVTRVKVCWCSFLFFPFSSFSIKETAAWTVTDKYLDFSTVLKLD